MDSYEIGFIIGRILPIIGGFLIIWFIVKIPSILTFIFKKIFPNPTKDLLKTYLFWVDFTKNINSVDKFEKKLKQIKK